MNRTMRLCLKSCALLFASALVLWPLAVLAEEPAASTQLDVMGPGSVAFGGPARIVAQLRDASGKGIDKAKISFYAPVSFLGGASDLALIDEAITDAQGVAAISYTPRRTESMHVVAKYSGDAVYAANQDDITVPVTGNHQIYQAEAGIKVPLVGMWILVAILTFIWGTYFLVVNLVLRISMASEERSDPGRGIS